MKTGAVRLSPQRGARYMRDQLYRRGSIAAQTGVTSMAAIIALALAVGIFGLLNLIDFKRLD